MKGIEMCVWEGLSDNIMCSPQRCRGNCRDGNDKRKKSEAHLGVDQPAMVERDVEQIKHDAFWGVLEDPHTSELHIHIQTCLQLVQDCHGIAHVLEKAEENSPGVLVKARDT